MEVLTGIARRENSNNKIENLGISCLEQLPYLPDSNQIKLRKKEEIAKRAIACLLTANLALDIYNKEDISESKKFFNKLLKKYSVDTCLTPDEKKAFNEDINEQETINLQWRLECVEVLFWILGQTKVLKFPSKIVDTTKLNSILQNSNNLNEFVEKCQMIDSEKILDEADLEYRYHWACVEKRLNSEIKIKTLSPDIVYERRRALEWVIDSNESLEWDTISLDT